MKAFTVFVAELNRGATNAALTGHLEELLQAVKTHGRAGALKITLKVVPVRNNSGADTIHVICDSQLALPKPQQPADFFFLTEEGEPTGYIYADPDSREIVAVYNDHKHGDHPGWRDHRAVFKAEYTPEFSLWINNNGHERARQQVEFASFLEDNIADIAEGGSDLLTVATTLQAKTEVDFKSARRLDNGQNQLTYVENISATAGANGALSIPSRFDLAVRIFKNGDRYKIGARLKYRLGSGHVKFWYELDRPHIAVEDAFAGYVEKVATESGYTTLFGKP